MSEPERLTHAFMRAHPIEAARVLESIPATQAAEFFCRVPVRLAARVLAAMQVSAATRCFTSLRDERAMELLSAVGIQSAVRLLRHLPGERRARLIAGLPTATAIVSKLLLGYPENCVGAWVDPDVIALPATTRAGDALERVRRTEFSVDRVFVLGAQEQLAGWVALAALLRTPQGVPLDALHHAIGAVLPASTALAAALGHPGWQTSSLLAVVGPGAALVGVLTRHGLEHALRHTTRTARPEREEPLTHALARGYWEALSGSVQTLTMLLPSVRLPEGTGHGS
jgi:Mg/Co/Ni transporter MgtE